MKRQIFYLLLGLFLLVSPAYAKQSQELKTCKTTTCLISQIKNCNSGTAIVTNSAPDPLQMSLQTATKNYKILKSGEGKCKFISTVVKNSFKYSSFTKNSLKKQGLSTKDINKKEKEMASILKNTTETCEAINKDLATYLNDSFKGRITSISCTFDDLKTSHCIFKPNVNCTTTLK
ncbi:MAG TPA: hypothetical protein VLK22_02750 [Candidatus Udaeobacter sp.]|nr:hypothetical protein [Candidatus Udaeobacter sp.]